MPKRCKLSQVHTCDVCHKQFRCASKLKIHLRVHTGEKPHVCDFEGCEYAFAQSASLTTHKRRHTGEKPYVCDFEGCEYACTTSGNLAVHKRIHSGEKPHVCNFESCGAAFTRSGDLTTHKRRHTGEKPYVCDFEGCDYACVDSGHFKVHKRRHTGEKPHMCDFDGCGAAFVESGHLKVHKLRHTGEKPHVCDFEGCGYACTTSGALVVHKRIHTGEKPYKCDFEGCTTAFAQSGELKAHNQRIHSMAGQQRQKKRERALERFLQSQGVAFKREHQVSLACIGSTFARIDFLIDDGRDVKGNAFLVFLEVDEFQHQNGTYTIACDVARMTKTYESLVLDGNTLPIVFVRFNTDVCRVDGVKLRAPMKGRYGRYAKLLEFLQSLRSREVVLPLSAHYMFYDTVTDDDKQVLEVTLDPEFEESFKPLAFLAHNPADFLGRDDFIDAVSDAASATSESEDGGSSDDTDTVETDCDRDHESEGDGMITTLDSLDVN